MHQPVLSHVGLPAFHVPQGSHQGLQGGTENRAPSCKNRVLTTAALSSPPGRRLQGDMAGGREGEGAAD